MNFTSIYEKLSTLNEAQETQKFEVIVWSSNDAWTDEAFKAFNLKKDKKARETFFDVMKNIELFNIKELFDRNLIKYLQSTLKNAAEVKWSINKVQYRIYCFIYGTKLYLMVPFIKSNGDKDTDAAGVVAQKRFANMKK